MGLLGDSAGGSNGFSPQNPGPIGGGSPSTITGTTITATTRLQGPAGSAAAPGITLSDTDTGWFRSALQVWDWAIAGTNYLRLQAAAVILHASSSLSWGSSGISAADASIVRAGANSFQYGTTSATTTARTELNKAVASIANAVATDVLTVTIPNAAHSASLLVRVTGSLGAGGAIGANEATATNQYTIVITRTAGVNAAIAISAASGAAASAVAGAATVTCTAALSAVSGAVGATNTFTVQATISRSAGTSTNHTCFVYAQLCNANASGITIS